MNRFLYGLKFGTALLLIFVVILYAVLALLGVPAYPLWSSGALTPFAFLWLTFIVLGVMEYRP